MKRRVKLLRPAQQDYRTVLEYLLARSHAGATAWAKAFDRVLVRLEDDAEGFPVAPENSFTQFDVRQALFKTKRGLVYRTLFTIEKDQVLILHVRGPGQDLLQADEFVSE